ncbi:uncharacterized protein SCHCODRAFT_02675295 [Schizophyllum commune H4-8]|uniref:Uncharacterized protein n=1 Tax=Schizophyllum commune (strain H4-8 / FGSC 9210) TaxID=578458 RepID=D8PK89_SCHCM|nr:uncharacterized protein SCHCODRAFT_02675295 [Schizophyllum commune H4-8]KAI5897693.1 hypothetical protein SCHCODRAFT_02675295 [Schizophyllum commune H4-8]
MARSPARYPIKPPNKKRKLYSPSPSPPPRATSSTNNSSTLPLTSNAGHRGVAASAGSDNCARQASPAEGGEASLAAERCGAVNPPSAHAIASPATIGVQAGLTAEEQPTSTISIPVSLPQPATAPSTPIPPAQFYAHAPQWFLDRAERNLSFNQFAFFQMLASILFARLSGREAAHYATWFLLANEYLTSSDVVKDGMKVVISTICPQLPVAALEDDEDPSDLIGDELSSKEGKASAESDNKTAANAQPGTSTSQAEDKSRHTTSPPKASDEISLRTLSIRIPDFVQVSHIFDLRATQEDIFAYIREIGFDPSAYLDAEKDGMRYLWPQVTLLIEIKLEDDDSELAKIRHNEQLDNQAAHFFASGVKENVIGGILALGNKYTYKEIGRSHLAQESLQRFDDQAYRPPTVRVQTQPMHRRHVPTALEKALNDRFEGGRVFINAHDAEGKAYLKLINSRSHELFPRIWGRQSQQ